jgi:hypothetical protein
MCFCGFLFLCKSLVLFFCLFISCPDDFKKKKEENTKRCTIIVIHHRISLTLPDYRTEPKFISLIIITKKLDQFESGAGRSSGLRLKHAKWNYISLFENQGRNVLLVFFLRQVASSLWLEASSSSLWKWRRKTKLFVGQENGNGNGRDGMNN